MSAASFKRRKRRQLGHGVNIVVILNVAMAVIFLGIVSARLKQSGESGSTLSRVFLATFNSGAPLLSVDSAGGVRLQGRSVTEQELADHFRVLVNGGIREVDLHGNAATDFGALLRVMEICRQAGIQSVNIVTEPKSEK